MFSQTTGPNNEPDHVRIRSIVSQVRTETAAEICVSVAGDLPLGLKVHAGDRDATLKRLMKQSGAVIVRTARECAFPLAMANHAEKLRDAIVQKLSAIAQKPLSPRQVKKILSISPAERLRWSKDGRLRQSGTAQILRGSTIRLSTYPPQEIERLLSKPEIITAWRQVDCEQP
ncbi:hypothetical protein [Pedomonas sp. V897]|jgi:hypothetical protein|uniref:hypothetical protein n=1 Tax=Pedomonas sp. V897 TaxID=3446482 RepID=UPI003EDF795E